MTGLQFAYDLLVAPFADFGFMRRALIACLALALGSGPVGVFLILRRMSLMGDALAHALLPGAAIGFILGGLSLPVMSLGGFVAGLVVALLSGAVARFTRLREEASFAASFLVALSLGVLIVSAHGNTVDLMHVLFGSILAVDDVSLLLVAGIATLTLAVMALIYRPLVAECFDPGFLRAVGASGSLYHFAFLVLAVLNLVAGFQALGTLMALGLMLLPAIAATFWVAQVWSMMALSIGLAFLAGLAGLLVSYHFDLPSGPSIVLVAGCAYILSVIFGPRGGLQARIFAHHHS